MESLWDIIKKEEEKSEQKPFNAHFDNKDLKFSELLSDERIVTSFKNQNSLLFKYIHSHPEVFEEMVDYITVEPKEEDTEDRKHRYPFISGEILSIENSMIYEMFFGVENDSGEEDNQEGEKQKIWDYKLLDRLLGYVNTVGAINPLLTGYCQKVFANLFHGNRTKLLKYWFDRYSKQYIRLMSNMNICNIVKTIITIHHQQNQELFNEERLQLLKNVLSNYSSESEEYRANTIDIFRQIFNKYLMIANGKQLLHLILDSSKDYLPQNQDIQEQTLAFVRDLLIKVNFRSKQEQQQNIIHLPPQFVQDLNKALQSMITKHTDKSKEEEYLNQSRAKVSILGKPRLFLIETIRQLVKLNPSEYNLQLIELGVCEWLLDLVQEFKFNSILHCGVQNIFISLIRGEEKTTLIQNHNIIGKLCQLLENSENSLAFGQLCNIFFELQKCDNEVIAAKMKQQKVVEVYQDVVLPRKQKYEFKWAGSITNFKSKPISFVEEEPSNANANVEEKKPANNEFDFDFDSAKTKQKQPSNDFNPFTTFPGTKTDGNKQISNDFNFF